MTERIEELSPPPHAPFLVCTVGKITVWPGASNVIAGSANITVDIRSDDDLGRINIIAALRTNVHDSCTRRGVRCNVNLIHEADAVHSDTRMTGKLQEAVHVSARHFAACRAAHASCDADKEVCAGIGSEGSQDGVGHGALAPVMVSGAGHDAMAMATLTGFGMMFVRCLGGVSHSPLEHVSQEEVAAAVLALHTYLARDLLN